MVTQRTARTSLAKRRVSPAKSRSLPIPAGSSFAVVRQYVGYAATSPSWRSGHLRRARELLGARPAGFQLGLPVVDGDAGVSLALHEPEEVRDPRREPGIAKAPLPEGDTLERANLVAGCCRPRTGTGPGQMK